MVSKGEIKDTILTLAEETKTNSTNILNCQQSLQQEAQRNVLDRQDIYRLGYELTRIEHTQITRVGVVQGEI